MSLVKKLFRGSIAQTLQVVVATITGLFMLPFMINQLGESLYGIWILIGGFTATLYLFDFGFATAVTRYMARHINQGDNQAANKTVNSALVIYTGLAFLVLIVTLFIAWFSSNWVTDPANIPLVHLLIVIAGINLAIEFPFKAFSGIITAYVRYDLTACYRIVIRLLATGLTIWALLSGYQLIAVALIQLGASIVGNVMLFAIARHLHKPLKLSPSFIDKATMKSLANYSGWAFAIDISRLAKDKAPIFLVASYLGTSTLTVFYVAVRLVDYSLQFLIRATGMSTPVFAGYQARGDMDGLKEKLVVFLRINFLLGFFAVYSFALHGELLIQLWMGNDFAFSEAYIVLVIMLFGKVTGFTFSPLSSVLLAISRHRWQALLDIFEVALSASVMFLGLAFTDLGLLIVAIGFAVPFLISRAIILPFFVNHEIGFRPLQAYLQLIAPILLISIAYLISTYGLKVIQPESVTGLLGSGLATSLLYWLLALIALKPEEWGYLSRMLPDKVRRLFPGSRPASAP